MTQTAQAKLQNRQRIDKLSSFRNRCWASLAFVFLVPLVLGSSSAGEQDWTHFVTILLAAGHSRWLWIAATLDLYSL